MWNLCFRNVISTVCIVLVLSPPSVLAQTTAPWGNDSPDEWAWGASLGNDSSGLNAEEAMDCLSGGSDVRSSVDSLILISNDAPDSVTNETWLPVPVEKVDEYMQLPQDYVTRKEWRDAHLTEQQKTQLLAATQRRALQKTLGTYNQMMSSHWAELKAWALSLTPQTVPLLPSSEDEAIQEQYQDAVSLNQQRMMVRFGLYENSVLFGNSVLNPLLNSFSDQERTKIDSIKAFPLPADIQAYQRNSNGTYNVTPTNSQWMNTMMEHVDQLHSDSFIQSLQFRPRTIKEFNVNMRMLSVLSMKLRTMNPTPPYALKQRNPNPCRGVKKLIGQTTTSGSGTLDLMGMLLSGQAGKWAYNQLVPDAHAVEFWKIFQGVGVKASAAVSLNLGGLSVNPGFTFKPGIYKWRNRDENEFYLEDYALMFANEQSIGTTTFGTSTSASSFLKMSKPAFKVSYGVYTSFAKYLPWYQIGGTAASGGPGIGLTMSFGKVSFSAEGGMNVEKQIANYNQATYRQTPNWDNKLEGPIDSNQATFNSNTTLADLGRYLFKLDRGMISYVPRLRFMNNYNNQTQTHTQAMLNSLKTNGGGSDAAKNATFQKFKDRGNDMKVKYGSDSRLVAAESATNPMGLTPGRNSWWNFQGYTFVVDYEAHGTSSSFLGSNPEFGTSGSLSSSTVYFDAHVADYWGWFKLGAGAITGAAGAVFIPGNWEAKLWYGILGLFSPFFSLYLVANGCDTRHLFYLTGDRANLNAACSEANWNVSDGALNDKLRRILNP
jgi:hypothetical protein